MWPCEELWFSFQTRMTWIACQRKNIKKHKKTRITKYLQIGPHPHVFLRLKNVLLKTCVHSSAKYQGANWNRDSGSVVFNSGQKMALRAFYFIRALTKAQAYYYKSRSQRHLLAAIENNWFGVPIQDTISVQFWILCCLPNEFLHTHTVYCSC